METFSLQGVPKGELIRTVKSPDGKYLIKTYFHNAGSLSADAVRGELVNLDTDSEKIYIGIIQIPIHILNG